MRWVTREHVKVDRVACPWLIICNALYAYCQKEVASAGEKRLR